MSFSLKELNFNLYVELLYTLKYWSTELLIDEFGPLTSGCWCSGSLKMLRYT